MPERGIAGTSASPRPWSDRPAVSTKLITAEDLEAMPETDRRYELVRGELVRRPFNVWRDAVLAGTVSSALWWFAEERELGFAGFGCGFVLGRDPDTVRAPEVAFIRAQMIPRGAPAEHFVQSTPDLAVEIVPPSGTRTELLAKADEYLAAGTRLTWTFDPDARAVVVKSASGEVLTLGAADTLDGGDVLPGFRLPLRDIFGDG